MTTGATGTAIEPHGHRLQEGSQCPYLANRHGDNLLHHQHVMVSLVGCQIKVPDRDWVRRRIWCPVNGWQHFGKHIKIATIVKGTHKKRLADQHALDRDECVWWWG